MVIPPANSGDRRGRPTFGYHHYLKEMYRKGMLPSVTRDIYGGALTPRNVTLEHLIPHSMGGPSTLRNYALATKENNNNRGCEDLKDFLSLKAIQAYLEQFRNLNILYKDSEGSIKFSGNRYIEFIKSTLRNLGMDNI